MKCVGVLTITKAPVPFRVCPALPLGLGEEGGEAVRIYRGRCVSDITKGDVMTSRVSGCTSVGHVGEISLPPSVKSVGHVPQVVVTKVETTKVNTRLGISNNYSYWKEELKNHPDRPYTEYVLDMVLNGAPVGHNGEIVAGVYENWPSAYKFQSGVNEYINRHIRSGAIEGPLDVIPRNFVGSPLGAFEKGSPKKLRIIHDLSWPPGGAVNDHIDKDDYSVQYIHLLGMRLRYVAKW